jgi:hypothetical protein
MPVPSRGGKRSRLVSLLVCSECEDFDLGYTKERRKKGYWKGKTDQQSRFHGTQTAMPVFLVAKEKSNV